MGASDSFVDQNNLTGTKTLMTVPLIGWVAKSRPSGHPYDCGFKISKYGSQQGNDSQWDPDCGNGILTNGTPVTGNDPLDTSIAITPAFVTGLDQPPDRKIWQRSQRGRDVLRSGQ